MGSLNPPTISSSFYKLHYFAKEEGSTLILASSEQIESLQRHLASLQNEKQHLEQECEKLNLEVASIHNRKSKVKDQMRAKYHDNSELREENSTLHGRITVLEKMLAEKEEGLFPKPLQKSKEELELHYEIVREEHAESLVVVENEKNDIASKTTDLQRTLEEREGAY
ncbi:hypothetical protein RJT34_14003 [Clitoria ternatea]|uniref:Uncharacterized protein n=1 Tax=Clitoria ternatea TaxID=43366 RepID=A0AAN9JPX5_CLITE